MNSTALQKRNARIVVGGIGFAFSAAYLSMSFHLPFGQMSRPGAAVYPVIVGALLVLSSLVVIWEGWRLDKGERVELPKGVDRHRLFVLLALLLAYCVALPYLGQFLGSLLFSLFLIRLLSDLRWPWVLAYSLALSVSMYVVFVILLNVPLPRGILTL